MGPKTRTASSHAASYSASGTEDFPGIQRLRTSSSSDSTWMPMAVAPASCSARIHARSPGGSHCTWTGSPGTAARTARSERTRLRAPRSWPVVVPVVITICRTPSSRTAASATSASCAGLFAATVAAERSDSSMVQKRQRSASA